MTFRFLGFCSASVFVLFACSSGDGGVSGGSGGQGPAATGGGVNQSSAAGGLTAAGGAVSTGGLAAAGGFIAAGGNMSSGGFIAAGGDMSSGGDSSSGGETSSDGGMSSGGDSSSGGETSSGGAPEVEVTLPDLQGGQNGFATRYWDCCKPSCGWSGNSSNPVDSCDINDNNTGVDDMARNGCEDGGTAYTCHNWAPWAKSDTLSYGFVAFNGVPCNTCFQLRFSGASSRGTPTPGLEGKQMVVQVTNIGGIEGDQFDILIPGGGVGLLNGCSDQWGVDNNSLGEQYGGFRSACGDDAGCVLNMCENAFGDSPDLMAGCDWFINWFQMADNPDIRFQEIECPQEILDRSGG